MYNNIMSFYQALQTVNIIWGEEGIEGLASSPYGKDYVNEHNTVTDYRAHPIIMDSICIANISSLVGGMPLAVLGGTVGAVGGMFHEAAYLAGEATGLWHVSAFDSFWPVKSE